MTRSKGLCLALVGGLGLCFAGVGVAQSPPAAQQPVVVVDIIGHSITPNRPPVGTNYTVTATVHSRHIRPVVVRGRLQVPQGDSVLARPGDVTIPAGGTVTLRWTVYCGVNGGNLRIAADVIREVR